MSLWAGLGCGTEQGGATDAGWDGPADADDRGSPLVEGGLGPDASLPVPGAPVAGQIEGYPFSVASADARWLQGGCQLGVSLASYAQSFPQSCSTPTLPAAPTPALLLDLVLPAADVAVGSYPVHTDYAPCSPDVGATATADTYGDAGTLSSASDLLSDGTVWITAVSSSQVQGAVQLADPKTGVSLVGTFVAPLCP